MRAPGPKKGRGATVNPGGRYETLHKEAFDDGWGTSAEVQAEPVRTEVRSVCARTVITRNRSPDVPFDRSLNPYQGCEHGCIYCYARPSHAYHGLSPGLDFETRILAKPDAARVLRTELSRPGYTAAPIALGANTDPYQPIERRLRITREVLEVLAAFRHPVTIVTKSRGVLRDLDILSALARQRLVAVMISVTTLDNALVRIMEPRASAPSARLEALRTLAEARVPCGVLASPMIPGLNDHELERILEVAARAGASFANTILLRLPGEVAELFQQWLQTHKPQRAAGILGLLRECRAGALNQSSFGARMRGTGNYAMLLHQRFELACRRLGLQVREHGLGLDCSLFSVPGRPQQHSLF